VIAVVQRVRRAEVRAPEVDHVASIGLGLVVLLGVEEGDEAASAGWLARKVAALRIFPDGSGRFDRAVRDVGGAVLVVSQFTLAGDCRRGNRPSFERAMPPEAAEPLYERFVGHLRDDEGIPVATGVFRARMEVELVNDGPVTILLRHPEAS